MRAHILQHVPFESPGSILAALHELGADVGVTRLYAGDPLPLWADVDLLVVMGGPMSVNDEVGYPWLVDEKALVADAIANDRRVLGVCLGAQVIASALGYRVFKNREPEIGWFPIQPTVEGEAMGLDRTDRVFHWHGETFDLPAGATLLASSVGCVNQAFALGPRVLGLQFHLEVTPADVLRMIEHGRHELVPGRCIQDEREILAAPETSYDAINAMMTAVIDRITVGAP